jgi:hypothetical protein
VDADSCFPELLLAVATVDMACRCCTLAIGGGNGVYSPPAQVKAAPDQIGDRNWNWEKKLMSDYWRNTATSGIQE